MQEQAANSFPSSSDRSSSSVFQMEIKEGMESEDEIRTVPSTSGGENGGSDRVEAMSGKRGRSSAEKEHKQLKRLLRNRVSAQQARERKKAYLSELEVKVKDMETKNCVLEETLSTLQNENQMLRHILKNTTAGRRGSTEC